ncbi:hypothetical protein DIE11_17955 [Burkholderia sp. Bp9012]|uniref:hypothetical protein n=1 Tax=Burkholderia sp. Bp9012 TaxID=2184562 RepID=UPI000F5A21C4|nr:hypothetical protein [Burkholderia sp. Bp9012]RQR78382.1 hypothetical protein DIE11_17955 [Burkholderia sp. Bp9012]
MTTTDIDATHVSRYLRIERAAAPVRANREVALLSNLIGLAIDRGEAKHNPCREVRRNEEQPRTEPPPSRKTYRRSPPWSRRSPARRR